MNNEQEQKALAAIERMNEKNAIKMYALMDRVQAQGMMKTCFLPYRICLDIIKMDNKKHYTEIMPNRYYPAPGASADLCYEEEGLLLRMDWGSFEYRQEFQRIEKLREKEYSWFFDAEHDPEDWQYYFARFTKGYDFSKFTAFDFFGCKATLSETESARAFFTKLQQRLLFAPETCFTEPNPRKKEHRKIYNVPFGYDDCLKMEE